VFVAERAAAARPPAEYATVVAVAPNSRVYSASKRGLDIALSLLFLLLSLPLIPVIAVCVRLDSPGPIIFRQRRVGLGGRVFSFYKFRTMQADARSRFPEMYAYRYTRQQFLDMLLKTPDDPRLTRLGRKLRTTSLDELPNLLNVLRGDMSLVGPRPELPEMVGYYAQEELSKFSVRPGVTGLWQVSGRAILRNGQQLSADVEYVKKRSLRYDLGILVKTAKVVLLRIGAF
jgi:lipopolysaccharide/colanic/teichoic acid biosynthesis glycosyltransferase